MQNNRKVLQRGLGGFHINSLKFVPKFQFSLTKNQHANKSARFLQQKKQNPQLIFQSLFQNSQNRIKQ